MKKIIIALLFSFTPLLSHAGIFIEPSFNYTLSGSSEFTTSAGSGSFKLGGYSMMGKLGFSNLGFSIGGLVERAKTDSENESTSTKSYGWTTRYGGFIGYQLPVMLGFGVAYLLPPSGVKSSLSSSMLSFSAGYSIIPLVKLTFSYSMSMQAKYFDSSGSAQSLPHTAGEYTYEDNLKLNKMALGLAIHLSF